MRVMSRTEFTFRFRGEFQSFRKLAAEAVARYVEMPSL